MMTRGATPEAALDTALEGVLIALLVFTPLAFGTVHTWAVSLMQAGLAVLFGAWLCRLVWGRAPARPARGPGGGEAALDVLGYRVARTGLGAPIAAFFALVALQLLPLPPGAVRALAPAAASSFVRSLPGWEEGSVDFGSLGPWLGGGGAGSEAAAEADALVRGLLEEGLPPSLEVPAATAFPARRPMTLYPFATWTRLLMLGALLMAFLVVVNAVRSRARRERLLWVVIATGFAISVVGIAQRLQWNGRIYWFYPPAPEASPFGSYFNHNHFAAYIELAAPLALGMCLARLTRVLRETGALELDAGRPPAPAEGPDVSAEGSARPPGRLRRALAAALRLGPETLARLWLSGFLGVVMLSALLLSGSRGGLLSLAAASLLYAALLAARRQIGRLEGSVVATALAAALLFALWAGAGQLGETGRRLQSVLSPAAEPSLWARLAAWQATTRIVADAPLMGSGLGTFPEAWIHHYPAGTGGIWKEAHNDYLQLAAETGLAGLGCVLWGLAIFLRRYLLRDPRRAEDPETGPADAYLHHGMAVGILSILLHSFVDFSLQVGSIALLFVVLAGLMAGGVLRPREA